MKDPCKDNFITTKAILGVAYYGCVICNYFGFLYDMWYGVETQLKNKGKYKTKANYIPSS